MRCFPFETLISFAEGTLDASAVQAVSSHLDMGCASCRQTLDWLHMVIRAMRSDDLQDPPREAVDRLIKSFQVVRKGSIVAPIRRFIEATLLFDSSQRLEFSGARSVQGSGKQLLYQAEYYDIDLRLHPADPPNLTDIVGQVLSAEDGFDRVSGIPLYLYAAHEARRSALTDELGMFHLRRVPEGRYDVKIILPDREITIRDVPVLSMA